MHITVLKLNFMATKTQATNSLRLAEQELVSREIEIQIVTVPSSLK